MQKKTVGFVATILSVLFVASLLFMIVDLFCFDKAFYRREYEKLHTANTIGVSQEELGEATDVLLDYLRGEREDLVVYANFEGVRREVFNGREKLHMADVKNLYVTIMFLAHVFLVAGVLLLLVFIFVKRLRKQTVEGYIRGNLVFFVILALLGLYAAIDFNSFWTNFHKLLFTNDLWLLDPNTDVLIMMVPEQFFFDLVMRIALVAITVIGVLLTGAVLIRRFKFRKEQADDRECKTA